MTLGIRAYLAESDYGAAGDADDQCLPRDFEQSYYRLGCKVCSGQDAQRRRPSAVASYDRVRWFRVPTKFDGGTMLVTHTPERASIYYAYFEPYSWERHLDLLGRMDAAPRGLTPQLSDNMIVGHHIAFLSRIPACANHRTPADQ